MTIQNRLKFITLVPIILLITLSSYFFITAYIHYQQANTLKIILGNNIYLSSALKEIDKERGLSAMFLAGSKHVVKSSLVKQRQDSDKAIEAVKNNMVTSNKKYLPFECLEKTFFPKVAYQTILVQLQNINHIRQHLEHKDIAFDKIFFTEYIKTLTSPILDNLLQVRHLALTPDISSLISIVSQLYIAKENTALERGFIAYYMTKQAPMSVSEIAQWDRFKTKANLFDISQISDTQLQLEVKNIFSQQTNQEIFIKLSNISDALQQEMHSGNYTQKSIEWFVLQTQKISLLSKSELIVSHKLWDLSHAFLKKQLMLLSIASIVLLFTLLLAYLGYKTSKDSRDEAKHTSKDGLLSLNLDKQGGEIEDLPKTTREKKKILIAKTFLLERKILERVIENLGYEYQSLANLSTLEQELSSGDYDLLFADNALITDKIRAFNSVYILTDNKSKEEIRDYVSKHRSRN